MPKLIDKYSGYEIANNGGYAATLLYGFVGDKISEERKLEILRKLYVPGSVAAGDREEIRRQYGNRFQDITKKADAEDLDMRDNSQDLPGISRWIQPGLGKYHTEPEMEGPIGVFDEGMKELLETLDEAEKDLDLSDPNAQNYYQMVKGILQSSYDGKFTSKMTEDPSYGISVALTAKVGIKTGTYEFDKKNNKPYAKLNGMDTQTVLRDTQGLGILEAMAGNVRVNDKLEESISNGNTSRQELLRECEEQSKRLDKLMNLTEEQVERLRKKEVLLNDRSEYTDGARGILDSVRDMKAKQDILKAGYPLQDIAAMSAFYVQLSDYNKNVQDNQAKLDAEIQNNPQPDENTRKNREERQKKINDMKEVAEKMQQTWDAVTNPENGPLTQEKRLENLGRLKADGLEALNKGLSHSCLNQFADRMDNRINAQLTSGDKAMLAGDYTAMYNALNEADPRSLFTGSKQFKDLKKSVKELAEMEQELSPEERKTDLDYMAKRREVLEKAQTYLRYKNRQMNGPEGHKHKRSALEAQRVQAVDGVYNKLLADIQRDTPGVRLTESEMSVQPRVKDSDLLTPAPIGEPKDFDSYLKVHTGKGAMSGTKEEMVDDMAKALAAQIMPRQKHPKEFDPKVIDKAAEQIKTKFNLAGMDTLDLREALDNPQSVKAMAQKQHRKTYSVEPKDYADYLDNMRRLYRDMEKPDGSSKEYQRIYDGVKKIAHLPNDPAAEELSMDKVGKMIEQTNSEIYEAMDRYVDKNAKKIGPRDPKMLQVLSAISEAVPDSAERAEGVVERIKEAKGITDISHPEYIEMDEYERNAKLGLRKTSNKLTLETKFRSEVTKGLQMDEREKLAHLKEQSQKEARAKEAPDMAPKEKKLETVKPEAGKKAKEVGDKAKKNAVKEQKQAARKKIDNGVYL